MSILKSDFKIQREKNYYIASIDWLLGLNDNDKEELKNFSINDLKEEYRNAIITNNEEFYENENIEHLIEKQTRINDYRRKNYD